MSWGDNVSNIALACATRRVFGAIIVVKVAQDPLDSHREDLQKPNLENGVNECEDPDTHSCLLLCILKRNLCETINLGATSENRGRVRFAKVTDKLIIVHCPSS